MKLADFVCLIIDEIELLKILLFHKELLIGIFKKEVKNSLSLNPAILRTSFPLCNTYMLDGNYIRWMLHY